MRRENEIDEKRGGEARKLMKERERGRKRESETDQTKESEKS